MIRSAPHAALFALVSLGLILSTGCDATGTQDVDTQYVVEAYLIAGEPLPMVRLSRTADLGQRYVYDSVAVPGADVRLIQLDERGEPAARYEYRTMRDTTGVYLPYGNDRIIPLTTYRLEVAIPATDQRITATTTVPDTFSIVSGSAREVVYQGPNQLEVTLTRSRYPGRDQSFYIFSTQSLEPRRENLTPLLREFIEDDDSTALRDLRVTASPVLNEDGYTANPDGTLSIKLPWLAVAFYGPNRTIINAIDDNLYDFVRTQSAQQGGGGFSPGTIPNVIEHVDGGTGVFGSLSRQVYEVLIQRPNGEEGDA